MAPRFLWTGTGPSQPSRRVLTGADAPCGSGRRSRGGGLHGGAPPHTLWPAVRGSRPEGAASRSGEAGDCPPRLCSPCPREAARGDGGVPREFGGRQGGKGLGPEQDAGPGATRCEQRQWRLHPHGAQGLGLGRGHEGQPGTGGQRGRAARPERVRFLAVETSAVASVPSAVESEKGSQGERRLERPEAQVSGEPLPSSLGSAASPRRAARAPRPCRPRHVCRPVAAPEAAWSRTAGGRHLVTSLPLGTWGSALGRASAGPVVTASSGLARGPRSWSQRCLR